MRTPAFHTRSCLAKTQRLNLYHSFICWHLLLGSSWCHTSGAKSAWKAVFHPDVIDREKRKVPQRGLEGRLGISWCDTSGKAEAAKRGRKVPYKPHGGAGIALFQIVLGLICPVRLSGGGKSQNEAKSRRFGMDLPSRAFYEGWIPERFGTTVMSAQKGKYRGWNSGHTRWNTTKNYKIANSISDYLLILSIRVTFKN